MAPENRDEWKVDLVNMLARSGLTKKLGREYDEIANMCFVLKRPIANCASLILRLELAKSDLPREPRTAAGRLD